MNINYKYLLITLLVILIMVPVIYYYFDEINMISQLNIKSAHSSNYSSYFYLNPIPNYEVASYKASCNHLPLEDLFNNPDSYKGQKIKETGQIANITFNPDGYTEILLYTPETNRDFTRLFVTYKGKVSYVQGDNIAAYGEIDSYTEYNIKMPLLKSVYIEKN